MMTLTAFADEISPEIEEQLDVLVEEDIHHMEFRGVWGKNVLRLSDAELDRVESRLHERGIRISSIGSPIGKISIDDEFAPHLVDFERALAIAMRFQTRFIRIFSFFIPPGKDPIRYRDEVLLRMEELTKRAEAVGVTLLHENEKQIYGDTPERCVDIHTACPSLALRAAFDPANFVQCHVEPFTRAWPLLAPYVEYVHIKDARFADGFVTPAGEGDGDVAALLATLRDRGYTGFLSLEPHLASEDAFSGFSGPERFKAAAQALKALLVKAGVLWH